MKIIIMLSRAKSLLVVCWIWCSCYLGRPNGSSGSGTLTFYRMFLFVSPRVLRGPKILWPSPPKIGTKKVQNFGRLSTNSKTLIVNISLQIDQGLLEHTQMGTGSPTGKPTGTKSR